MRNKFQVYFLFLACLYLGVEYFEQNTFRYILKPLLLLSLSIYFYKQTVGAKNLFSNLIQAGLFFSFIGDCALLFAGISELYFIIGLLFFLVAQVCYCSAFRKSHKNLWPPFFSLQFIVSVLPFVLLSAFVFFWIKDSLHNLLYPVLVYILVITLMGILAALRYKKVSFLSFSLILAGAIFFMISDTLLAINKFKEAFNLAGVSIMSTYILAQFLIVEGSLVQLKEK